MNDYVIIRKNTILTDEGRLFNATTGEEIFKTPNTKGYIQLSIDGSRVLLHRLVMQYFGSNSPDNAYIIDHIDRNRLNNAIWNLRWVSITGNNYNKNNNLPIGSRACDLDKIAYNRLRARNSMRRRKRAKDKGFDSWKEYQKCTYCTNASSDLIFSKDNSRVSPPEVKVIPVGV